MIELSQLKTWWEAPIFLWDDESHWPQLETIDKQNSNSRELKRKYNSILIPSVATLVNVEELDKGIWRLHPNRFSSRRKLTRILAWVLRFINNCTKENKISQAESNEEEISVAENHLIKEMQKKEFKEEYSSLITKKELPTHSKLLCLCPNLNLTVREL